MKLITKLKLNHYPCQVYLHRFGLADSPTCTICGEEDESVEHILLKCTGLSTERTFASTDSLCEIFENTHNQWKAIDCIIKKRNERIRARVTDTGSTELHQ